MNTVEKITWIDAGLMEEEGDEVWFTLQEIKEMYSKADFTTITVGIILFETKEGCVVAQSYSKDAEFYSTTFFIPKNMIIKREILWEKK